MAVIGGARFILLASFSRRYLCLEIDIWRMEKDRCREKRERAQGPRSRTEAPARAVPLRVRSVRMLSAATFDV